jgi:hypothetical protein
MQDTDTINGKMTRLLASLIPGEGICPSILEGVSFVRADRTYPPSPVLYEPSIVIVAQGQKKGYLGGQVYRYDPYNYLVLAVPLPFESETTEATPTHPMLGVAIEVDLLVLTELLMKMDAPRHNPDAPIPQGICSTPLDRQLSETIVRLLEHLTNPETAHILGPQTVQEILYRILGGAQGSALRELVTSHSHFSQISDALKRIHSQYAQALDMKTLADEANMSLSVFHRRFKEVTSTSPVQYLKMVRLHKARMLMAQEGVRVALRNSAASSKGSLGELHWRRRLACSSC